MADDWIGTSINVWRIRYHNVIGKPKPSESKKQFRLEDVGSLVLQEAIRKSRRAALARNCSSVCKIAHFGDT